MGNSKSHIAGYEDGTLEINLSNFKLLRVVGKGSYGKVTQTRSSLWFIAKIQVRVVELKNSESKVKETFALKYIRKVDCVRADFAHNIIRERRILQELEHPLIVNLRYAFQDEEFMYMVSDLMYYVGLISWLMKVGRRFAISYQSEDIHRGSRSLLDRRNWLRLTISSFTRHCTSV